MFFAKIFLALLLFVPPTWAADPVLDSARATAVELVQRLGAALKKELATGGPDGAVTVCRDVAPALYAELSRRDGSRVTRVSLKTRNPLLGLPDAWEQGKLLEFDRLARAGEKPETLEWMEIVDEPQGRYFRYLKAIPLQPLCVTCHGSAANIPDSVKSRLASEYPYDRATGYTPGEIRGAVSIRRLLEQR